MCVCVFAHVFSVGVYYFLYPDMPSSTPSPIFFSTWWFWDVLFVLCSLWHALYDSYFSFLNHDVRAYVSVHVFRVGVFSVGA